MKHEVILGRTMDETRGDPLRAGVPMTRPDGSFRTLAEIQDAVIDYALNYHPTRDGAARALGIGRSTLYRKLSDAA